MPTNILDKDSGLKQMEGRIDIVHTAPFLHLFCEKRPVQVLQTRRRDIEEET